ncbi:DUF2157 domain-containing protein [Dyadobacter sediminis]|uniref:DUF2157 domain-containing protein n=1 Tax=Dyadobacter sediminis TaxID=1493691 RepID=A0A5R9KFM4_9BACT|nr:DUF2157 domain-containing protein [Dyadobacter sediminis]TLU94909.1 DUF2157 domain-containing protein [Dyadobacter sediminis]GGB86946.1 hypothetical protein GCM10011325_13110 [Dyadobacter sediminis]
MNTQSILRDLVGKKIISESHASLILEYETAKPLSVHWELRYMLYTGILLFNSGLGMIIYENIDSIGHQAMIAAIALLTAACFYYAYQKSHPYSHDEILNSNKLQEYILLLGCVSFLALEGYLQFQYELFGSRYGIAVIIPTILFFVCAYRFDHRGVLSMAITGLASWLGLTIAPLSVVYGNNLTDLKILNSAIILGTLLTVTGWLSERLSIKKHFSSTYIFLGGNLAALAAISGLINQPYKVAYAVLSLAFCLFFVLNARRKQSHIFLLIGIIYAYITVTYLIFFRISENAYFSLMTVYLTVSSIGVIYFLLNFKKILGTAR